MTMEINAQPRPTLTQGLTILAGAIPLTIGFFALQAMLGVAETPLGFFFILYWGGVEQARRNKLASTALGAFSGLGLAYLLKLLTSGGTFDPALGGMIFLGVILVVLLVLIMNWLPLFVNTPAMLLLTVGAYPAVLPSADFAMMAANLLLGVVYFGGLLTGLATLTEHFAKAKSKRAASAAA